MTVELQLFTLLKPRFLVNVQRSVVLFCGQSRQVVHHSDFAQCFLCEAKTKAKMYRKYSNPPVIICLKLLVHLLCRTLISWLAGLAENPSVRPAISV